MQKIDFETLIFQYKECVKVHFNMDYSSKISVKKGNKAVEKMIKISKAINSYYLDRILEFAELLEDEKYKLDLWVAHHILENMTYSGDIEKRALKVIEKYAKEDSLEGLGNRMWLKEWYEKENILST